MSAAPALPDFNLIAPVYDGLAGLVFGQAQKRAQAHFLHRVPANARVLILGGGSGWILLELLKIAQPRHVLYLEASARMLQKAQTRLQRHPTKATVEFRLGTEQDLRPQEQFNVIITPFVLDLFLEPDVRRMISRLHHALLPAGLWLHTDFQLSPTPLHQLWQKPLLWGMYRFFGFLSKVQARQLPDAEKIFREMCYTQTANASFFKRFIQALVLQKPNQ